MNNICHFIPYHQDFQAIHTINFVLETKPQIYQSLKTEALFKVHYVRGGSGYIHTLGQRRQLHEGDIFFTFPGVPFAIESKTDFTYMYISFLGARTNSIMEKINISKNNFFFPDCGGAADFWEVGINTAPELTELMSESVLLYTFAFIGGQTMPTDKKIDKCGDAFVRIKKYTDENFTCADLSLNTISTALSYNPKYISAVFKKEMSVGLVEYINIIRIQYACTLMKQGLTSVNDIAYLSGYKDPMYFSKVFKKKIGVPPRQYISALS
ncbi:MAG: AraC family transcriptional regulator [Monoglobaceae bacterium]